MAGSGARQPGSDTHSISAASPHNLKAARPAHCQQPRVGPGYDGKGMVAARCDTRSRGSRLRLVVYVFLAVSAMTLFAFNDVVVIAVTPVVYATAIQAEAHDTRPLLRAQFIAANTVSMGLLTGSPTNPILGDAVGLGFAAYGSLMLAPTMGAFLATLCSADGRRLLGAVRLGTPPRLGPVASRANDPGPLLGGTHSGWT